MGTSPSRNTLASLVSRSLWGQLPDDLFVACDRLLYNEFLATSEAPLYAGRKSSRVLQAAATFLLSKHALLPEQLVTSTHPLPEPICSYVRSFFPTQQRAIVTEFLNTKPPLASEEQLLATIETCGQLCSYALSPLGQPDNQDVKAAAWLLKEGLARLMVVQSTSSSYCVADNGYVISQEQWELYHPPVALVLPVLDWYIPVPTSSTAAQKLLRVAIDDDVFARLQALSESQLYQVLLGLKETVFLDSTYVGDWASTCCEQQVNATVSQLIAAVTSV